MVRQHVRALVATAVAAGVHTSALGQTNGTWVAAEGGPGPRWSTLDSWVLNSIANNGGTATFGTTRNYAPTVTILQDLSTVTLSNVIFTAEHSYLIKPFVAGNTFTLVGPAVVNTPVVGVETLGTGTF